MPFKSQAQRAWMYAEHPAMAARWEAVTPKGAKLPVHVAKNPAKRPVTSRPYASLIPGTAAPYPSGAVKTRTVARRTK